MSIASRLSTLIAQRAALVTKLNGRGVSASTSETFQSLISKIDSIPTGVPDWIGSFTFSGTYATSSYYTAANCYLFARPDLGIVAIVMRSANNANYENLLFTAASLPSGVSLFSAQSINNYASATTQQLYIALLMGVTGKLNVAIGMNSQNATPDNVTCAITATYA